MVEQCTWKKIVELISHPEGQLRVCSLKCSGYDTNCPAYTTTMKGVIQGKEVKIKNGLERFFIRYPDYNYKNINN